MRIVLDTNVVLRNAITADAEHAEVVNALEHLIRRGHELCISMQVAAEFWVVATRDADKNGLGLTTAQAGRETRTILDTYTLIFDAQHVPSIWIDLCIRNAVRGRQAHDARLAALMLAQGITHIISLNKTDFVRYSEITCLLPSEVGEIGHG